MLPTDRIAPPPAADLLIEAVQALSLARSLPELVDIVQQAARTGAGADGATFVLRDGDDCFHVAEAAVSPRWHGRRCPVGQCASGWAMSHGQAIVIADIDRDPRIPADLYRPDVVRTLVIAPIRTREALGAIGLYWSTRQRVSGATVRWWQALANATSAGLESVLARQEARWGYMTPESSEIGGNLVRMCAWTRRLWHEGEWRSVEDFLLARFGLKTTHGISPEAIEVIALRASTRPDRSAPPVRLAS